MSKNETLSLVFSTLRKVSGIYGVHLAISKGYKLLLCFVFCGADAIVYVQAAT